MNEAVHHVIQESAGYLNTYSGRLLNRSDGWTDGGMNDRAAKFSAASSSARI